MDHNELVNEILARVMAKLTACETVQPDGCGCGDPGKPGLLILTQEHGEDCHAILEDACLLEHYHTDCARMQEYAVDVADYDVVVAYQLTNDVLCKVANGVCDTSFSRLLQQAILLGKRVFVPTEQVEALHGSAVPGPYCQMLQEKLEFLKSCGLIVCSQFNLVNVILNGSAAAPCPCTPAAKPAEIAHKELCLTKRVITERDVSDAATKRVTRIRIGEKSILTALAKDYAQAHDICLIREEQN